MYFTHHIDGDISDLGSTMLFSEALDAFLLFWDLFSQNSLQIGAVRRSIADISSDQW